MFQRSKYRVLIAGILSPVAAVAAGLFSYLALTRASSNRNADFVFRLTIVTVTMAVPFFVTVVLALVERRHHSLSAQAKIGIGIAALSLCMTGVPLRGLVGRLRQSRNEAVQGVLAPGFNTVDILGKPYRLQENVGKVVLVNSWATWCPPCRKEMPELDKLYRERKNDGLIVFGLSTEDAEVQRKFSEENVHVSYPLLTTKGDVAGLYTEIQRWPALFLIDREGRLQPVPQSGAEFYKIEAAVDALLKTR